jgi:hypothetical protein
VVYGIYCGLEGERDFIGLFCVEEELINDSIAMFCGCFTDCHSQIQYLKKKKKE